jgi:CheY-like chemotaxis protein/glycine cleavage system H lipoate-binding protein
MNARTILVIEDEHTVADAVAKIFGAEGVSVTITDRASEGLRRLEKNEYRLIFCDIMLPDIDGFQFLEELADRDIRTPVVMMTGYSTVENAVRSLSMGAVDYVPKPFTTDELLAAYKRSLRTSRLLDQAAQAGLPPKKDLSFVPCPNDYYRLGYASWAHMEESGTARIGVSDLYLKAVGDVQRFELYEPGDELAQGVSCATVIARDGTRHEIMCPLGGRILETNSGAATDPAVVEKDPYFQGWLYRIIPSNPQSNLRWLTL